MTCKHGWDWRQSGFDGCPMCADENSRRASTSARVLQTYEALHAKKIVGEYWLWVAIERIAAGEQEQDVLADYGYAWMRPARNKEQREAETD